MEQPRDVHIMEDPTKGASVGGAGGMNVAVHRLMDVSS